MRKPTENDKNHDLHVIEQIVPCSASQFNFTTFVTTKLWDPLVGNPPTKPVVIGISMDFTQRCACQGSKKDTQQKRYSLKFFKIPEGPKNPRNNEDHPESSDP